VGRRQSFVLAEIVTPAERHDTPFAFKSVELEFLVRKIHDPVQQEALISERQNVRTVAEAWRKGRIDRCRKKHRLNDCHGGHKAALTVSGAANGGTVARIVFEKHDKD
jgi:hypothetical protein